MLPEGHQSVEKQSCKRRDNNERPNYQNARGSFWSTGFVFRGVLAEGSAAHGCSGWGVLSFAGGPFIVSLRSREIRNGVAAEQGHCDFGVQASPDIGAKVSKKIRCWSEIGPNYLRASSAAFSNVRRSVLGSDQVVKNNLSFSHREKSLIFFNFST